MPPCSFRTTVVLLLAASCGALVTGSLAVTAHAAAAPPSGVATLVQQITNGNERSQTVGFAKSLSEWFAPEGVHVAPGPTFYRGPAGALAWLQQDGLNATSSARWSVLRAGLSADGRDAYVYGYVEVTRASGETLPGKFHSYWRQSDAGAWQILAFSRGRRASGPVTQTLPEWLTPRVEAAPDRRDTAVILRELMDTEREFSDSVGTNVAAAFGEFAAPDAAKLEGGSEYAFGPAAIAKLFGTPPPGALGPAWLPEWGGVAASGDLGFTLGPSWPRAAGKVQTPPDPIRGRYFTIWQRQANGAWRYLVD